MFHGTGKSVAAPRRTRRRCALALALGASVALGGAGAVLAETPAADAKVTTTTTTYQGWSVQCTDSGKKDGKACAASFRVIDQKSKGNLLVWLMGKNAKGEKLAEFLTLTDVLIKPGVGLSLDDAEPVRAEYVSCGGNGCKASLALDKALVAKLKSAKKARVDMTRLDGQVIQFTMDVTGIAPAMADIGF